jgi:hypothetical protein
MNMINVLERLAELDKDNPNVINPMVQNEAIAPKKRTPIGKPTAPHLKSTGEIDRDVPTVFRKGKTPADFDKKATTKKGEVKECNPMESSFSGPASLSINASAPNSDAIACMLKDLMSLAGVQKYDSDQMPLSATPGPSSMISPAQDEGPYDIRDMIAIVDKTDDSMNKQSPLPGKIGDNKPEIEGAEEENLESYDNTPNDPTNVPADVPREYQPNKSNADLRRGSTNAPRGQYYKESLEDYQLELFDNYQKFISESN